MKPRHSLIIAFLAICSLSSCTGGNKSESARKEISSIRDSVLIYKIEGLKAFIKEADYWGDDTESYWAYGKANEILDSITDYTLYDESLAHIYSATSYVFYGLSYFASVLAESQRYHTGEEDKDFIKVGIKESGNIIIRDSRLIENDSINNLVVMEMMALLSITYYFKAIDFSGYYDLIRPNFVRTLGYGSVYTQVKMSEEALMKLNHVCNMLSWYNFTITLARMSHHELYGEYPDIDTAPWNEFTELAYWHDALIHDVTRYENISDEELNRIEVKAAYTQCIMMKHLAENLAKLKEKRSLETLND